MKRINIRSRSFLTSPIRTGGGTSWSSYWDTLISATVEDAAPDEIVLTFPEAKSLTDEDFTVTVGGVDRVVSSASWTGAVLTLTLASDVLYTDTVVVTFVRTGGTSAVTNNILGWFKITVDTTKAGSANDTFVFPLTAKSASDVLIDWGDGGAVESVAVAGSVTHIYASSGTYQVSVHGGMTAMSFNNAGDKAKTMTIDQWGDIAWRTMISMFYGCSALTGNYTDTPNTAEVVSMASMFRNVSNFNSPVNFNTANVETMDSMFSGCNLFNQSVSTFNTSKVTTFRSMFYCCENFNQSVNHFDTSISTKAGYMFRRCFVFNQDVSNFVTSSVTNFSNVFENCLLFKQSLASWELDSATDITNFLIYININTAGTTTNYDATLVAWANDVNTPNSLTFHGGTSKYGEGLVDSGTADGTSAGKLADSTQNFLTTVTVGDVVYNTTDGTYAFVTGIDSDTQLSLSVDIMVSGEAYRIQHGTGAKARAKLVIPVVSGGKGWTITDGEYL